MLPSPQIETHARTYSDVATCEAMGLRPCYSADCAAAAGQVCKSWGREHCLRSNKSSAHWLLQMDAGGTTSLHCHPSTASTVLVVTGEVTISFLHKSRRMQRGQGLVMGCGTWHRLEANAPSVVVECLYPNRRSDLLRIQPSAPQRTSARASHHDYLRGAKWQTADAVAARLRFSEDEEASLLAFGCLWSFGSARFHRQHMRPQCGRLLLSTTNSDAVMLCDAADPRLDSLDPAIPMFSIGFDLFEFQQQGEQRCR